MAKTSLLPPVGVDSPKKVIGVRLDPIHYQRLERIAEYRRIRVAALLFHLVATMLPQMEREMDEELAASTLPTEIIE